MLQKITLVVGACALALGLRHLLKKATDLT